MITVKEDGYEIIASDNTDMVEICMELCKGGFHFKAFYQSSDDAWHIYLTGGF